MPGAGSPEPLPFAPGDLVLDYSLEQRAFAFVDSFDRAVEQWYVRVTAETGVGDGDAERVYEVGWASGSGCRRRPSIWHPPWHPMGIAAIAEPSPPRQIAEHKATVHLPFRRYC